MLVSFYEVYCTSTTAGQVDGTVCDTFEKKWEVRQTWINKNHVVSLTEHTLPDIALEELPKKMIKDAGFSRLLVLNGTQPLNIFVVGGPEITLRKLRADAN